MRKLYFISLIVFSTMMFGKTSYAFPISVGGAVKTAATNNLDSACTGINSGTLNLSGHLGDIIRWESSTTGGNPWSTIAHTSTTFAYSNLVQTTYFRAIVKVGSDPEAASSSVKIRVDKTTRAGTLTGDNTVCTNSNTEDINLNSAIGLVSSWQTSFDDGTTWNDNSGITTKKLTYINLTTTTWYRTVAKNGACSKDTSNIVKVIVNSATLGGKVLGKNGLNSISTCYGIDEDTLSLSSNSGNVIGWEKANSSGGPWSFIFNNGSKQVYKNLTTTSYYRAIVAKTGCDTVRSAVTRVLVDPASKSGTLSGVNELCTGTNSSVISVSSSIGSVQNWLQSTNNVAWTVIANPLTSYNISNLAQTTWYKTFTKSGVCANDTSAAYKVTVNAPTVGGNVSGTANICFGINSGTLSLTGNTGSVLRWQSSETGNNPWADMVNTSTSVAYSKLQSTTSYRAVVQNEGCNIQFSSASKLTIDPTTNSGNLGGFIPVCISGNSGKVFIQNKTGGVTDWIKSTNSGSTWTSMGLTNDSVAYTNVNAETWYRSIVKSGVCVADTSAIGKQTISPATVGGSLSDSATVCAASNGATIKLSGHTGKVLRWETSASSVGPWASKNNSTDSLVFSNLLSTIYYRSILKSEGCSETSSSSVKITVVPITAGGNLVGSTSVCQGNNSGTITLRNQSGKIDKWQVSNDTMKTWTDVINTSTLTNYTNLNVSAHYRTQISGGACGTKFSDTAVVWVNSTPIANFSVTRVCQKSPSVFTNQTIKGNGNTYFWAFGNGKSSSSNDPKHIYNQAGTYSVQMIATSVNNCKSSIIKTAIIDTTPIVNFSAASICQGKTTPFVNASTPSSGTSIWAFGNGASANTNSVNYTYPANGSYSVKLTYTSGNNCFDSIIKTVIVNAQPKSIWFAQKAAEGKALSLTNNSTISTGGMSSLWKFGDGNTSVVQNPTHTYSDTGDYAVELISFTGKCSDTLKKIVVVNPVPQANYSVNKVCVYDSANFVNNTFVKKGGMTYKWDFGDGTFSTDQNPKHLYAGSGAYKVSMEAITDSGYVDSKLATLIIYEKPVANFTIVSACLGDSVEFIDASFLNTGTINYNWNFGVIGGVSIAKNPKYSYTTTGPYSAKLIVSSNRGCVDSVSKPVTVHALPSVNFISDTVCDGSSTKFSDSTTVTNALVSSYSWDFGNNNGSNIQNPLFKYNKYGTYTVKLKVTTNRGCLDSNSKNVIVNALPVPAYTVTNLCVNDSNQYTNSSTYPFTGVILTYNWNFGNSTTSTTTNPRNSYSNDGSYNVKLVVTETASGCKDSITQNVISYPRSTSNFSSVNVCLGKSMVFQNSSVVKLGNLTSNWNFGDLATSTMPNPKHTYQNAGKYTVQLVTNSIHNCSDTVFKTVWVNPQPKTNFSLTNVCFEDSAYLFDNGQYSNGSNIPDTAVSFAWDFGDGSNSNNKNPSHYYSGPGNYKITLTQNTDSGCVDLMTKNITIYANPVSDYGFTSVCFGDTTPFINRSISVQGSLKYYWDFADTKTDTLINTSHVFSKNGKYDVIMVAISEFGCTDTINKTVISHEAPSVNYVFTSVCDGFQLPFTDSTKMSNGSVVTYAWDFGDGTGSSVKSPIHLFLNNGKYDVSLEATSDKGCREKLTQSVEIYEVPIANFTLTNTCLNADYQVNNTSAISANGLSYSWDFGDGGTAIIPEPIYAPEKPGKYKVKLVAISTQLCKDSITRDAEVYEPPNITLGKDTSVSKGIEMKLQAEGGIRYEWFPQNGLDNSTIKNPVFDAVESTAYSVTGYDRNGCSNVALQTIEVSTDYNLIPTNVITPDGNGQNDFWIITNIENYIECQISIFNRWGSEVLKTTGYQNDWDGRNENGDILPDGTYYYTLSFPNSDKTYKGAVSIIRNNK